MNLQCGKCGKIINESEEFCGNCGAKIDWSVYKIKIQCPECGAYHLNTDLLCPRCGRYTIIKKKGYFALRAIFIISSFVGLFIPFGIFIPILWAVIFHIMIKSKNSKKEDISKLIFSRKDAIIAVCIVLIANVLGFYINYKETVNSTPFLKVSGQANEKTLSEESKTDVPTNISEKEIAFRDISWGSSFPDVNEKLGELKLWNLSGEAYLTCSIDEIILGNYKGIDFDYGGINIISHAFNGEQEVAGYTTSEITLYFAYLPVGEYLSYNEKDTSLYGAQYKFEPVNLQDTYNDLKQKLTDIYGEPSKVTIDSDLWENKYTYTYWYGAKNTELVLRCTDSEKDTTGFYEDEIYITYAWRNGDTLLQNASDAVKREKSDKEKEIQGNGNSEGL